MPPEDLQSDEKAERPIGGLYPPAPGPGRPKGSQNKTTLAQREFAERVLGKPGTPEFDAFVDSTRKQLLAGILPPAITSLILHYAYGKPKETVEVQGELEVITEVRRVVVRAAEQVHTGVLVEESDVRKRKTEVTH